MNAKTTFDTYIAPSLTGKDATSTIEIFSKTSNAFFMLLAAKYQLKERQIAAVVGFKDEFIVELLVNQVLQELNLTEAFYCKKITANATSGLASRRVSVDGQDITLTIGGDCVLFRARDNRPLLIIECKEYIDMIRLKELIGESRIIKDEVKGSELLLPGLQFWVFAEVLELTKGWGYLLHNSNLKYNIDQIFVLRGGKRKDTSNTPQKSELLRFKRALEDFLTQQAQALLQ